MIRRRALLAAPALTLPVAAARAQAWPSRPVRVVLAYPPGGSTDVLARTLAAALQDAIPGSTFVVDNRPGGAAVVGTQAVAQAAADGYTLSLGNNQTHAANAAMLSSLPYDPVADFAPIARLAAVHHALVVPANGPRTLAELAAKGKNGGRVTYASSGVGSASHVIAETFVRRERMDATHVPYRGGAQATTDTVAGTVDFFVSTWPQVVALVREGRLRALGIGAPARLPETPDVPTFAELNAQDLAVDAWFGLWAPARTPAEIVARLSDALQRILAQPEMQQRLTGQGFVAAPLPAEPFAAFQREEVARWRRLVELTGIRLEG
ncbi:Bug family tripartite tricarboxylate transporter substrate binding protein [Neoroseomonas soli]|uniref:Tripartite tricarboxylate transporter substrate binding protein n=1 Tax=Neoroseomonas soli TaxID=1081025 RepID=A0A9X9WXQ2_9PROT|nr:tripartite tricarboxylate transporter substrate binding protein [Neoroseomonas soli]MBR0671931.1 tripartite tricarboxylate transporter substrate binding protein [Neoroseomonas soli]